MARISLYRPLSLLASAWLAIAASLAAGQDQALRQAIDGEHRAEANRARDRYRHPDETLAFFGIRPDMTVVEIWPGAGWYTEILAPYLREGGTLYAAHFDITGGSDYQRASHARFVEKLAAAPEIYDRVNIVPFAPDGPPAGVPDGVADLVVTFRNVHNWYMRGGGEARLVAAFRQFHRMLKPGGTLGVVDHRLASGRPLQDQEASGYMNEQFVIRAAEQAGFELVAKSGINANPRDTTDHPKGVWTLPPTLAEGDTKRDEYLRIGESDRMTLRFAKPAAAQ